MYPAKSMDWNVCSRTVAPFEINTPNDLYLEAKHNILILLFFKAKSQRPEAKSLSRIQVFCKSLNQINSLEQYIKRMES